MNLCMMDIFSYWWKVA